jgi:hypothetical protein
LNVTAVEFAGTVTDAGAVRAPEALFVSVTVAPPGAAAGDTVTRHVATPLDDNVIGVQVSPLRVDGATSETLAVAVVPFSVPERVAV